MQVYCGIDWAESDHDVALVDQHGTMVAKRRINDDPVGFGQLMTLLAEHGDSPAGLVPVAIETSRGLLVAGLRGTGRSLYVITPLAGAACHVMPHCDARFDGQTINALIVSSFDQGVDLRF